MTASAKLAELLFPDITKTLEDYETIYPPRVLPKGAKVTRIAPSPTGFMHLGNLFGAMVDERLAHQSGGVFYLRIEDTDQKRKVDGAVELIDEVFKRFGLEFDEGFTLQGDKGAYGPYVQQQRGEIYRCAAKALVAKAWRIPVFARRKKLPIFGENRRHRGLIPVIMGAGLFAATFPSKMLRPG